MQFISSEEGFDRAEKFPFIFQVMGESDGAFNPLHNMLSHTFQILLLNDILLVLYYHNVAIELPRPLRSPLTARVYSSSLSCAYVYI